MPCQPISELFECRAGEYGAATFRGRSGVRVYNKRHGDAPPGSVYVGRGSPFGNPFVIGRDGDRDEVCEKFERAIRNNPPLMDRVRRELKGKNLVCFCKPERCHGDTLLRLANEEQ